MGFEYKQAIVVRQDLKMSKGKTAAQVAHAAISSFEAAKRRKPAWAEAWLEEGQKKVILKAPTLDEILSLERSAALESLPFAIIADAGLTELEPGTVTCLGVGPAPSSLIDKVTGKLKLL